MSYRLVCPINKEHNRFVVTAHVTEEWEVDQDHNFLAEVTTGEQQVIHQPDSMDLYECMECKGAPVYAVIQYY